MERGPQHNWTVADHLYHLISGMSDSWVDIEDEIHRAAEVKGPAWGEGYVPNWDVYNHTFDSVADQYERFGALNLDVESVSNNRIEPPEDPDDWDLYAKEQGHRPIVLTDVKDGGPLYIEDIIDLDLDYTKCKLCGRVHGTNCPLHESAYAGSAVH
ncbi:hypothetical protein CYLTODRAFT_423399 [Cylindrobasidium torrendii FP15055 ss-10]|uniref:Uncharacterized protein n=1 Tax=Cylindrobasidium torrendii FP15055 ss-10 TaxID=1314674 RepID=A0A0D7B7H3_9AGAR|nr:hypothetical protein CYLTODRAFT_423399 [Cylindrobasidium torrendii FP15055 ss-10]